MKILVFICSISLGILTNSLSTVFNNKENNVHKTEKICVNSKLPKGVGLKGKFGCYSGVVLIGALGYNEILPNT